MCIIFVYRGDKIPGVKLLVAFNRDESKTRPTAPAGPWASNPNIIAGADLSPLGSSGGTWLGVNKNGKLGALLNIHCNLIGLTFSPDKRPRGRLVTDYLEGERSIPRYVGDLGSTSTTYNYFNLVLMDFTSTSAQLAVFDNVTQRLQTIAEEGDGVFCLGNVPRGSPNPRVEHAYPRFTSLLRDHHVTPASPERAGDRREELENDILNFLRDETEIESEYVGSYRHIFNREYEVGGYTCGTVSSTVVVVATDGTCTYTEITHFGDKKGRRNYQWKL